MAKTPTPTVPAARARRRWSAARSHGERALRAAARWPPAHERCSSGGVRGGPPVLAPPLRRADRSAPCASPAHEGEVDASMVQTRQARPARHEETDQQHLVVLPRPPRERRHPHDEVAEFFHHIGDPETGWRELNIALPPGWMSIQLDRLTDRHEAPTRLWEVARRAWLCWNG